MSIFKLDEVMNNFGQKLIEAMNSQIIRDKVFPAGTVKHMSREATGWGDLEVRFQVTTGAGDASLREVRVRQRMGHNLFEIQFVQKTTGKIASRFYQKITEEKRAIEDMITYVTTGVLTQNSTHGSQDYEAWLNGEELGVDMLFIIQHGGFNWANTPITAQLTQRAAA
jgi:hypothetical protein